MQSAFCDRFYHGIIRRLQANEIRAYVVFPMWAARPFFRRVLDLADAVCSIPRGLDIYRPSLAWEKKGLKTSAPKWASAIALFGAKKVAQKFWAWNVHKNGFFPSEILDG